MTVPRPERHLDPDTVGSPLAALPGLNTDAARDGSVALLIEPAAAATVRGQTLAWVTVNLLARLYGALGHIRIACPDVPLAAPLPALTEQGENAHTLPAALVALADALADDSREHPKVVLLDDALAAASGADATLVAGSALPAAVTSPAWLMSVSNWKLAIVNATIAPHINASTLPRLDEPGQVMVAAWFAATVGVGEVFKTVNAMRPTAGRQIELLTGNLWAGVIGDGLDALASSDGPADRLTLPAHFLVGVGAVGQSYLAVLSSSHVDTDIAALDHDELDERNLNRHPLAGVLDIGAGKATLARERLGNDSTRVVALPYTWQTFTRTHPDDKPPLPPALEQPSRTGRYGLVISAVDKNPARLAIAGAHPQLIFSGSTNGLAVEIGRYARDSPWQCLSCASPVTAARTLEQAAASLDGKTDEDIEAEAAGAGLDPARLRQYLAEPTCGSLGAREMEKFAAFTRPDWSVSFVSVAAGTLLTARVLRHAHDSSGTAALPARAWRERGDTIRLWMLKAVLGTTAHRRRADCPICHGQPTSDTADGRDNATW